MRQHSTSDELRFYGALRLVTAATLMLQIIETRIISVASWYHRLRRQIQPIEAKTCTPHLAISNYSSIL